MSTTCNDKQPPCPEQPGEGPLKLGAEPQGAQDIIEEEAALWLVKIDNRALSPEEVRAFKSWLRRSDCHHHYITRLAHQWDAMGALGKLATLFPLGSPVASEPALSGRWRWPNFTPGWSAGAAARSRVWQWQGALALTCLLLVLTWLGPLNSLFAPTGLYQTAVGDTGEYTLADGSVITLNTNTLVQVAFTPQQRRVQLLRGEAHFTVAKNPERPFVVAAGGGEVQAVGTAFNVRLSGGLEAEIIDVIVTEGRVSVGQAFQPPAAQADNAAPKPQSRLLAAGEQVQYHSAQNRLDHTVVNQEAIARQLAWQQGSLVFQGETLEQAMAEISRYTAKRLLLADPALRQLPVGGRYKTDDIDQLLISLAQVMALKLNYSSDDTVIFSAKKSTAENK